MAPLRRVLQFWVWTRTPSPLLQPTTPPFQFQQVTADNTRCSKQELGYTTLAGWGRCGPPNGSRQDNRRLPTPAIRPQEMSEVGAIRIRDDRFSSCASGVSNVWGEEIFETKQSNTTFSLCWSSTNSSLSEFHIVISKKMIFGNNTILPTAILTFITAMV